ncbi:NUDIX hydrolase [Micromonospora sp. C95]|uniref:NUDIX domain-containing protein n=1 Tax=Micromonospora sp. C95 TaxID=2824882 RepID=UPI001B39B887|nr:NUDIX hydrolase [Micromonospora sp. C95]MBQ1022960.1 NUDIX hydrolase [Micromonospora sp. C95]
MPSERRDVTAGLPRKRMAAGLLITDADDRVLLVEPVYKAGWEVPGGCVEADESPYQAAIRECREELGLDLAPGRLLVVDWVPARTQRTEGLMVIYDGGTLDPRVHERIVVPPGELKGWAFSDPPEAAQRLPPLLTRRITEALNARADGCSYYLEDGVRVT